jgi:regulator of cell morphogenesis and NO signaling
MNEIMTKTVREIAVEMPVTTRIFEQFKIDYCCGGARLFDDACQAVGVAPEIVSQKINEALLNQTQTADAPEAKNLSDLIEHILDKHHVFTKSEISRLAPLMEKVCRKHGEHHEELIALENEFRALCHDLAPHMQKEETVLFPYIKRLESLAEKNLSAPLPPFGTVKNPVRMMMLEHDTAGDILRRMRAVTSDYAVPENACPSYRALYFGLEELEKDLHQHIHLENNVLFPRAVELEEKVFL